MTTMIKKPFSYIPGVAERVWNKFIADVVNPTNNTFYLPRSEDGSPIAMPDNGPNCRHIVNSIIRVRLLDGSEKLYSLGQIIGYDSFGMRRSISADFCENYNKTIFGYDRKYENASSMIITYTTGPMKVETVYTLDFSPENVDMLYQKTDKEKNPYFRSSKRGKIREFY